MTSFHPTISVHPIISFLHLSDSQFCFSVIFRQEQRARSIATLHNSADLKSLLSFHFISVNAQITLRQQSSFGSEL
jgi:hypothetical protein